MPAHRKPVALRVIDGSFRGDRHNAEAPKPKRITKLPAPPHLSPRAKAQWPKMVRMLDGMGVLTTADALALESLCETYADLVEARAALRAAGSTSYEAATKAGGTMTRARPEVALIADADRRLRMWLADFGLTPAARSRVSANAAPPDADDPYASV